MAAPSFPALPGLFLEEPFYFSDGFEGVCAPDFGPGLAPETSKSSNPKLLLFKSIFLDIVVDAFSVINTQKSGALEKNK